MKIPRTCLFLKFMVFLTMAGVPCAALAQEVPPPPCCGKTALDPGGVDGPQCQVTMPDSVLLVTGISRSQFVDRLAATLYPEKQISLVYSITSTITVPPDPSAPVNSPVSVQVTYQYKTLRSQMKAAEIDALDELAITDGVTSIRIKFTQDPIIPPLQ